MSNFLGELFQGLGRGVQSGGNTMADVLRERARQKEIAHERILDFERGQTARTADQEYQDKVRGDLRYDETLRDLRAREDRQRQADVGNYYDEQNLNLNRDRVQNERDRVQNDLSQKRFESEIIDAINKGDEVRLDKLLRAQATVAEGKRKPVAVKPPVTPLQKRGIIDKYISGQKQNYLATHGFSGNLIPSDTASVNAYNRIGTPEHRSAISHDSMDVIAPEINWEDYNAAMTGDSTGTDTTDLDPNLVAEMKRRGLL